MKTAICGDTVTNADGDTCVCLLRAGHDIAGYLHSDGDEKWPLTERAGQ